MKCHHLLFQINGLISKINYYFKKSLNLNSVSLCKVTSVPCYMVIPKTDQQFAQLLLTRSAMHHGQLPDSSVWCAPQQKTPLVVPYQLLVQELYLRRETPLNRSRYQKNQLQHRNMSLATTRPTSSALQQFLWA